MSDSSTFDDEVEVFARQQLGSLVRYLRNMGVAGHGIGPVVNTALLILTRRRHEVRTFDRLDIWLWKVMPTERARSAWDAALNAWTAVVHRGFAQQARVLAWLQVVQGHGDPFPPLRAPWHASRDPQPVTARGTLTLNDTALLEPVWLSAVPRNGVSIEDDEEP